jgi:hypothetical protein
MIGSAILMPAHGYGRIGTARWGSQLWISLRISGEAVGMLATLLNVSSATTCDEMDS